MKPAHKLESLTTAELSSVVSDNLNSTVVREYARNLCESRRFIARAALNHSSLTWMRTMTMYRDILESQAKRLPVEYRNAKPKPKPT